MGDLVLRISAAWDTLRRAQPLHLRASVDAAGRQVRFERPELVLPGLALRIGPPSSVQLATTFLDERVRLGRGSRGSRFVFARGGAADSAGALCAVRDEQAGTCHRGVARMTHTAHHLPCILAASMLHSVPAAHCTCGTS